MTILNGKFLYGNNKDKKGPLLIKDKKCLCLIKIKKCLCSILGGIVEIKFEENYVGTKFKTAPTTHIHAFQRIPITMF